MKRSILVESKEEIIELLELLIAQGRIMIFDPNSKRLYSGREVDSANENGDAIQINLAVE